MLDGRGYQTAASTRAPAITRMTAIQQRSSQVRRTQARRTAPTCRSTAPGRRIARPTGARASTSSTVSIATHARITPVRVRRPTELRASVLASTTASRAMNATTKAPRTERAAQPNAWRRSNTTIHSATAPNRGSSTVTSSASRPSPSHHSPDRSQTAPRRLLTLLSLRSEDSPLLGTPERSTQVTVPGASRPSGWVFPIRAIPTTRWWRDREHSSLRVTTTRRCSIGSRGSRAV